MTADSPLWFDADPSTDEYGFSVLPAAECSIYLMTGMYDCFNETDAASFWTTSDFGGSSAQYIFFQGIDFVSELSEEKTARYSCRCVKDSE